MTLRLRVQVRTPATPDAVWAVLTDWAGQSRWIPMTTVRVIAGPADGVGGRVEALSGFWVGRVPIGLLDRFVVTGWQPPANQPFTSHPSASHPSASHPSASHRGELEVLHLGPWFTGEGVFAVEPTDDGSRIVATEVFALPGGRVSEAVVRIVLPAMRWGFTYSLRRLARLSEPGTESNRSGPG